MIPAAFVSPLVTIATGLVTTSLVIGGAYLKGRQDGREAMLERQLHQAHLTTRKQEKATDRVVVEYRDRVQVVTKQGKEVVREVERLVPFGLCQLDPGFRLLHDAAAAGSVPDPAGRADGPAAPVEQATAAETVADNYLACRLNAEQLTALQRWIRKQERIANKGD